MNIVHITITGPVMENMSEVEVSDDYASEKLCLDHGDVETAKAEGQRALLELILDNIGSGYDILDAANGNGSTVILDGENLDPDILRHALAPKGASPSP